MQLNLDLVQRIRNMSIVSKVLALSLVGALSLSQVWQVWKKYKKLKKRCNALQKAKCYSPSELIQLIEVQSGQVMGQLKQRDKITLAGKQFLLFGRTESDQFIPSKYKLISAPKFLHRSVYEVPIYSNDSLYLRTALSDFYKLNRIKCFQKQFLNNFKLVDIGSRYGYCTVKNFEQAEVAFEVVDHCY